MRNCGISSEGIQPGSDQAGKDGELVNNEADISANSLMEKCDLEMDEVPSGPVNGCQANKVPLACEGEFTSKRQKVGETEEVKSIRLKATESSVVEWLKNLDEGVSEDLFMFLVYVYTLLCSITLRKFDVYCFQASLIDILEHFNGSNEDSVVELLNCLEGDFSIYKKGSMYRVM